MQLKLDSQVYGFTMLLYSQQLFNQLFADLVQIPQLRMTLLPLVHSAPSQELTNALIKLQKATIQ